MIERKLHYELLKSLYDGKKIPALVYVKTRRDLAYAFSRFQVVKEFPIINAVGVELGFTDAVSLSMLDQIDYITSESRVSTLEVGQIETLSLDRALIKARIQKISANKRKSDRLGRVEISKVESQSLTVASGLDGNGVGLCVLDTGVNPHVDLWLPTCRVARFVDLVNGNEDPYDDNGHGTFVSGVALGNGVMSAKKIMGVAPKAELISVKAISENGSAGAFKILEGMQWILDNKDEYNIKVVCMSFGADPVEKDPLILGAETLVKNGICVVVASGNSGSGSLKSPAVSPYVLSVGSVDDKFEIADFTSRGRIKGIQKPDVYAKGVKVTGLGESGYVKMSGTSVSAPYVAGACCLLKQKYPEISPLDIKKTILNEAEVYGSVRVIDFV